MNRLTFYDVRTSRIPVSLGLCSSDRAGLCSYVNEAQQRLVQASGDSGFWGSWVKMAFNTTKANPYITTPREVARLINIDICRQPVRIQNEFYEFLEFGNGLQRPRPCCETGACSYIQVYDRGVYPTMTDMTSGNTVRVYLSNIADLTKRVFFNAIDSNGLQIYSLDNGIQVNGLFVALNSPFVDAPVAFNSINGIQKDVTIGPVSIYQVDATTGAESLLATLAPDEGSPIYRRYFLNNIPCQCGDCDAPANVVQVTAMAKLDPIPVRGDTDTLLIQNISALKSECMAIRLEECDSPTAKQEAQFHHKQAIKLLNNELTHFMGREMPALIFSPFGNAKLEKVGIGMV